MLSFPFLRRTQKRTRKLSVIAVQRRKGLPFQSRSSSCSMLFIFIFPFLFQVSQMKVKNPEKKVLAIFRRIIEEPGSFALWPRPCASSVLFIGTFYPWMTSTDKKTIHNFFPWMTFLSMDEILSSMD